MPTWMLPIGSLVFALVGLIIIGTLLALGTAIPQELYAIELIAVGALFGASGQAQAGPKA